MYQEVKLIEIHLLQSVVC